MGFFSGINKKGAFVQLGLLYLCNAWNEGKAVVNNGFSKFAVRDAAIHMKNNTPLPYYGLLASVYRWGDSGLLNALGINDIKIHRKPLAVQLWAVNQWETTEKLTNGIQALQDGRSNDAIWNAEHAVKDNAIGAAAFAVTMYKWGPGIEVKL